MRKLVLLAAAAAALAVPVSPASAGCTRAGFGGTSVSWCERRIWEKQQYYVTCSWDDDLDGEAESYCDETVVIEIYG